MKKTAVYDLRKLLPLQRHQLAFQCFDALGVGDAFELISDHEPRGLQMQFLAQRAGAFSWTAQHAEPGTWRILIRRTAGAGAAPSAVDDEGCCACNCG